MAYTDKKSAYDAEKLDFDIAFGRFAEKRFAIYGIGRMSATLLPELDGYRIVGLLDRDSSNLGKVIYGYPVISLEEAEKKADLIVINTAESYWNIIYNRIQEVSIPVYFKDGTLAEKVEKDSSYHELSYWNTSYKDLQKEILRHDIISFDIFDTLIMRTVMEPIDIFYLIELQTFFELRKKASAAAEKNATLTDIYLQLQLLAGLSDEQTAVLKNYELEIELKNFRIREDIACLLREAIAEQKEVYLISDMYMESDFLADAIYQLAGIQLPVSHILVSSERKKRKSDGSLWKEYAKEIEGRGNALHIGDDKVADEIEPQKVGIDTYRVLKANEILENSSLASIRSLVCGVYESVVAGHIIECMFNSPFVLNETKGKVEMNQLHQMGYCVLGPIIYIFLKWLLKKADEKEIKDYLFVARDGWFLLQDYEYLVELSRNINAPKGHYVAASRRLASIAAIKSLGDLEDILYLPYQGTFSQLMEKRFNVSVTMDENAERMIALPADVEIVKSLCIPYMDKMNTEIDEERKNYQKYLEQFPMNGASAIVDFCYHGTIQYYLQKIVDIPLDGYYFFADISETNPYYRNNMFPCFQAQNDRQGKESEIYKKWILLESFLTAPYGMIRYVDEKGEFVCDKKGKNQQFFNERIKMNDGVKHFIGDMVQSGADEFMPVDDRMIHFIMKNYGCMMEGNSILGDKIRRIFYFDNDMVHGRELNIFE